MIGISHVSYYIPEKRLLNLERLEKFDTQEVFVKEKIGIEKVAVKNNKEETSDLAVLAVKNLLEEKNFDLNRVKVLIVITQNPDHNIPHTSAVVHGKLGFDESCACFDVSLGCSGYVYGLSIIKSFMLDNNLDCGLLITSDPYSKILNPEDKNTSLLFGDAATATLVEDDYIFDLGKFNFGTIGKEHENLICSGNPNYLSMNGRGIFNFAARYVPKDIELNLKKNNLSMVDIDRFVFHQGSKYIVDTLTRRMNIDATKVPYDIRNYGNTVSSSIPIILSKILREDTNPINNILISGFGVGLSWASCILKIKK